MPACSQQVVQLLCVEGNCRSNVSGAVIHAAPSFDNPARCGGLTRGSRALADDEFIGEIGIAGRAGKTELDLKA
jgi:hypothetical protein